eukprot:scaffold10877_cov153-Skeletonema_marinoi.AAC.11
MHDAMQCAHCCHSLGLTREFLPKGLSLQSICSCGSQREEEFVHLYQSPARAPGAHPTNISQSQAMHRVSLHDAVEAIHHGGVYHAHVWMVYTKKSNIFPSWEFVTIMSVNCTGNCRWNAAHSWIALDAVELAIARECQKADWPNHQDNCDRAVARAKEGRS